MKISLGLMERTKNNNERWILWAKRDVYAYSKEGAMNSVSRHHKNGFGANFPVEATEITKDEFRGNHVRHDE